jgi:LmbE family N-acetylglucosaminyl deacetylase
MQTAITTATANMDKKGLHVNHQKCAAITFTETESNRQPTSACSFQVADGTISNTSTLSYLGALADTRVSWSDNTKNRITRAKRIIGKLRRKCHGALSRNQLSEH